MRLRAAVERARAAAARRPVEIRLRRDRARTGRGFARTVRTWLVSRCIVARKVGVPPGGQESKGYRILGFVGGRDKEPRGRFELLDLVAHLERRDRLDLVVLAVRRFRDETRQDIVLPG